MSGTVENRPQSDAIPPGWSYNPAAWTQRIPIVVLAFIGGVAALYLTLFQWNILKTVWEPFFTGGPGHASGSTKILKSPTSEMFPWPITDGFLGFLGYVFDALFGLIGGVLRWRTMPWVVILFGLLVGPLGAVSIGLVITQPLAYNTFCTLCMFTALVSVVMIGPAMDEMLASLQYMKRVRELRKPFWPYFWGRAQQEYLPDPQSEAAADASLARHGADEATRRRRRSIAIAGQVLVAFIGVYLMAAPAILGYAGAAGDIDRFIGPLVASFATMAAWEVLRNVRWVNIPLAVALGVLAISPWPWRHPADATISDAICAVLIIVLTLLPYPSVRRYGGGWKRVFGRDSVRSF